MAEASDRSLFLEMIKLKAMTVNEIVDTFTVAKNTARNWTTHPEVEKVVGSWPPQFVRRNVFVEQELTAPPKKPKTKNTIELPEVNHADKERFFRAILDNDEKARFNFTQEFREAESYADVRAIKTRLISCIVITEYYMQLLAEEEN